MKYLSFVLVLLALSACAPPEQPQYTLVIRDHRFEPAVLKVPRDTAFRLIVDNQDPSAEEFESHDLDREKIIPGNSQAIISIGALQPGSYRFFGEFNEDTAQGELVVN